MRCMCITIWRRTTTINNNTKECGRIARDLYDNPIGKLTDQPIRRGLWSVFKPIGSVVHCVMRVSEWICCAYDGFVLDARWANHSYCCGVRCILNLWKSHFQPWAERINSVIIMSNNWPMTTTTNAKNAHPKSIRCNLFLFHRSSHSTQYTQHTQPLTGHAAPQAPNGQLDRFLSHRTQQMNMRHKYLELKYACDQCVCAHNKKKNSKIRKKIKKKNGI